MWVQVGASENCEREIGQLWRAQLRCLSQLTMLLHSVSRYGKLLVALALPELVHGSEDARLEEDDSPALRVGARGATGLLVWWCRWKIPTHYTGCR